MAITTQPHQSGTLARDDYLLAHHALTRRWSAIYGGARESRYPALRVEPLLCWGPDAASRRHDAAPCACAQRGDPSHRHGAGKICIDGVWHGAATGIVSRWVTHSIRNTGDSNMTIFTVFTPPGLEQSLRAVSRPRVAGEPEPDPAMFTLPDNLAEVLDGSTLSLPEHAEAHNRNALVPPRPAVGLE